MLTAKEAYKKAKLNYQNNITETINEALTKIEEASNKGLFTVDLNYSFWAYGSRDNTPEFLQAKQYLENLGYSVTPYYDQIDDSYGAYFGVIISWNKAESDDE